MYYFHAVVGFSCLPPQCCQTFSLHRHRLISYTCNFTPRRRRMQENLIVSFDLIDSTWLQHHWQTSLPSLRNVMPWWSFVNGVHLPGSRTPSFNNEPPLTRWTWLHDSAQGCVLLDSPEPIRNTQTLVAQTCPGNEFALSCIMRASMGAVWLHQGRVWQKKGRLEGGNAGFNEMWVCAEAHLHSSGLWRGLTGVRRGRAWITHNRSSNWPRRPQKWLHQHLYQMHQGLCQYLDPSSLSKESRRTLISWCSKFNADGFIDDSPLIGRDPKWLLTHLHLWLRPRNTRVSFLRLTVGPHILARPPSQGLCHMATAPPPAQWRRTAPRTRHRWNTNLPCTCSWILMRSDWTMRSVKEVRRWGAHSPSAVYESLDPEVLKGNHQHSSDALQTALSAGAAQAFIAIQYRYFISHRTRRAKRSRFE